MAALGSVQRARRVPIRSFVRPSGFEPETCGLRVRCSAIELEARRDPTLRPPANSALDRLHLEELFEAELAELAADA
jgi:hypothetical protein